MGIRKDIQLLIMSTPDDGELAIKLSELAATDWELAKNVGHWGPLLYARNRQVFAAIILRSVSSWTLSDPKVIEPWMAQADANGDYALFRALYECSLASQSDWGRRAKYWENDFITAFRSAPDRGARRTVIEKYGLWFDIDDDFALSLYQADPVVAKDFLIRRLDRLEWHEFEYTKTAECARDRGDTEFYFDLYRRTFSVKAWKKDVMRVARQVQDPADLCEQLKQRHISTGQDATGIDTFSELLEARGADVLPYLERYVPATFVWGAEKAWAKLAQLAWESGYRQLWSSVVKSQVPPTEFAAQVSRLCKPGAREWDRAVCLAQIAGAQTGWSTWRIFVTLDEKAASELYDAFPDLCRGAFAVHLHVSKDVPYHALAQAAAAANDDAMVDLLSAKAAVTGQRWSRSLDSNLDWYVDHYQALDEPTFARRAMNVLGQAPKVERHTDVRSSTLYRLFFGDVTRYRSQLGAVRDLLESSTEDVRRVGLRMISDAGFAGIDVAVRNSDHLAAYLLCEAQRSTRVAAFDALAVAAQHSRIVADDVLFRAREALDLRRRAYPTDRLIELIGRILHRWPELRGPREQPVVFGQEAAW